MVRLDRLVIGAIRGHGCNERARPCLRCVVFTEYTSQSGRKRSWTRAMSDSSNITSDVVTGRCLAIAIVTMYGAGDALAFQNSNGQHSRVR